MKKSITAFAFFCIVSFVHAQVTERFTNSTTRNTYSNGSFSGEGAILWTYVQARGNQQTTANGDKAISLNKSPEACLYSDTITNGIRLLSFQYEQELNTDCNASVFINDSCIATLTTFGETDVTKYFSIYLSDFSENAVIRIQQNSKSSGQITIDDIYIEFAQTPFVCNSITHSDSTITAVFSHSILSAIVTPSEEHLVHNVDINKNIITVRLHEELCGTHTISFTKLCDTANTACADTSIAITFFAKPTINDVVITEIMADPTPAVGLPEYEYVEIYNRSSCPVQCSDLTLVVGDETYDLPPTILQPLEYLCLLPEKASSSFEDSSHFLFLKSFPSITNNGQHIALIYNETIISSVAFSDNWYQNSFKQNGGWSLEKIDENNVSETIENWNVANNRLGGTPGYENSVGGTCIDLQKPSVASIQIVSDSTIYISFSENIPLHNINDLTITPNVELVSISPIEYSLSNYLLQSKTALKHGLEYSLEFSPSLTDNAGNNFLEQHIVFATTDSLLSRNSIIINEILFNPTTGLSDFVELYNTSESYYDLSHIYLSNGDTYSQISKSFTLFPPHSFVLISPSAEEYRKTCQDSSSIFITTTLPSMPDDMGIIMLLNKWDECIDSVSYDAHWHSSYITEKEGVSLERISYTSHSNQQSSWFSSAESAGFSTPGYKNSQFRNYSSSKNLFSLESDVVTPNGDGLYDDVVLYCEDAVLNGMCNVRIFSTSGIMISQVANNQLLGTRDVIRWNCTNADGNFVSAGVYIVLIEIVSNGKRNFRKKMSCTILRD